MNTQTIYDSALIGGLCIGYTMLGKSLFKLKPADLGKLDFEDSAKLIGIIAGSIFTKDFLIAQGIIPKNIG